MVCGKGRLFSTSAVVLLVFFYLAKFNGEMGFGGWNIGSFTKVVWFLAFSYEIGTGLQTFTIPRYNSLFDRIVFRCNNH